MGAGRDSALTRGKYKFISLHVSNLLGGSKLATTQNVKVKKQNNNKKKQLVAVLDAFSARSVHVYMLRQEDLSFPGELLLSALWEGRFRDAAGPKLAQHRRETDGEGVILARGSRGKERPSGRGDRRPSPEPTTSRRGDPAGFIGTELK